MRDSFPGAFFAINTCGVGFTDGRRTIYLCECCGRRDLSQMFPELKQ